MVKFPRWEIGGRIAISHPKTKKYCIFCRDIMSPLGVIAYINEKKTIMYDWIHISCIKWLGENSQVRDHEYCKCSYCGEDKKLIKYNSFYLHKKCSLDVIEKVNKLMELHGPEIVANCI